MRVAQVIHDLNPESGGGATVAALNMALSLAQAGVAVEVWTSRAHGWTPSELPADSAALRVIESPGSLDQFGWRFFKRFEPDLGRIDLLHHHNFWRPHSARLVAACARLGKPVVQTPHGALMRWAVNQKSLKKRIYLKLVGASQLRRTSAVQMLNRAESDQTRQLGVDFRYFELPNSVSAEFANLPPRGLFRAQASGLEDKLLILSMGRLDRAKGADLLLKAFLDLANEFLDIALVMAGPDGGMLAKLEAMLVGHPHAARVHLPGLLRGRLRLALFSDADIFAQCSIQEAASMSIIEAAMAGKAMLVTDRCNCPGIGEVGAGLVVEYSVDAVREGLRRLISERHQLHDRGENARRFVEQRFSSRLVTSQLIEHYKRLIAGEEYPWILNGPAGTAVGS